MISLPIVPQIVTGAKSSTAAPLSIQRESWRATNPRVLDLTKWNGFLLLFFKLWALFRWLKILDYLYFEGRVKVVLKNNFGPKTLVGMLIKLIRIFLKRLYWLISRDLMNLEIKFSFGLDLFRRPLEIEGPKKGSFL